MCDVSSPSSLCFLFLMVSPNPWLLDRITEISEWLHGATQTLTHDRAYCRSSSLALICSDYNFVRPSRAAATNISCISTQSGNYFKVCDIFVCLALSKHQPKNTLNLKQVFLFSFSFSFFFFFLNAEKQCRCYTWVTLGFLIRNNDSWFDKPFPALSLLTVSICEYVAHILGYFGIVSDCRRDHSRIIKLHWLSNVCFNEWVGKVLCF